MSLNAEFRNPSESNGASHPENFWSKRRINAFLANRTPETWLSGLLGFAFVLLILVRLHPNLLYSISG